MLNRLIDAWHILVMFKFFRHHPYVYPRMLKSISKKILFKKSSLRNIVIEVTRQCNAKCVFCYARPSFARGEETVDELSPRLIFDIIRWAGKNNVGTINLSGGEALLSRHIFDYVKACNKSHVMPILGTNGLILTPEKTDKLREAGLTVITCSIHALGDRHDEILGIPGSFERIISNLDYAISRGMVCFCNHVLTKESIARMEAEKIIKYFLNMGCAGINLLPVGINSQDLSALLDKEGLIIYRKYLENPKIRADIKNYFGHYQCPAAWEDVFINYRADVTPCPFLPIKYGNLMEDSLENILAKMRRDHRFKSPAPLCLATEDAEWVKECLLPVYKSGDIPMHYAELNRRIAENCRKIMGTLPEGTD